MDQKLIVIAGPETGRSFSLVEGNTLLIGRGQASNTRINDPRLSRVHCRVEVGSEGPVLVDNQSTGGTFVRGSRVQSYRLKSGDVVEVGDTKLRFLCESANSETSLAKGLKNPPAPKAGSPPPMEKLIGQTLGHFRIERLMHKGGSSFIFRAEDQKASRAAVVKVMLPSITADEEQRSRFVRAVHTMIKVRHPNLVEIYGAGKQGPFCWCAMEPVDGISVLEMIELIGRQGRLDWREVYRIGVHVARALQCAHQHKVIHRNVTPDNLLQRKQDKVVKLCDLMLAKALEGTQSRQVTAPGQLIGNVAYMSPERMIDTSNLDWRSDQYGLGATIFALLTGHPPFQGKTLPQLIQAVRGGQPTFPDEVKLETPTDFLELVLTMLGKTPDQRLTFPSELMERLGAIGQTHGVDADAVFDQ